MAKSFVFPKIRKLSRQVGPFPGLHVSPRESPRIDLRVGEFGEAFQGEHLGEKKCLRPPEEPSGPAITVRNLSRSMNGALACDPRSAGLRGSPTAGVETVPRESTAFSSSRRGRSTVQADAEVAEEPYVRFDQWCGPARASARSELRVRRSLGRLRDVSHRASSIRRCAHPETVAQLLPGEGRWSRAASRSRCAPRGQAPRSRS